MHEHRVLHLVTDGAPRELVVVISARPHVFEVEVAIRLDVRIWIFLQTRREPSIDGPVRVVHGDMAGAITMLREKRADSIALLSSVAFLQRGKTKVLAKLRSEERRVGK